MDLDAEYTEEPPSVVFRFCEGGRTCNGAISLQALASLAGCAISTQEEAVATYRRFWRKIHAAAIGLHACGQAFPFVRRSDVAAE